jgi:hypothetical protein
MGSALGRAVSGTSVGKLSGGSGDAPGESAGGLVIWTGDSFGVEEGEKVGRLVGGGAAGDFVGTDVIFSGDFVDGERVGCPVICTGDSVGVAEGDKFGRLDGAGDVGDFVGSDVVASGELVGNVIVTGRDVGASVGGDRTGDRVGALEGDKVGRLVGTDVTGLAGPIVGRLIGRNEGVTVGVFGAMFDGGGTGITLSVNIDSVNVPAYSKRLLPVTKKKYCTASSARKGIEALNLELPDVMEP